MDGFVQRRVHACRFHAIHPCFQGARIAIPRGIGVARAFSVISSRSLSGLLLLGSLAALTIACQGKGELAAVSRSALSVPVAQAAAIQAAPVQAVAPVQVAPVQAMAPVQAAPVQAAPVQAAPVQAAPVQPTSMPMFAMQPSPVGEQMLDTNVGPAPARAPSGVVLSSHNLKTSKVRTVSDEHLPKWVPAKGRLTVVDSSDLAENLGLVPKGTTKKTDERISVADKLSAESAAKTDSMQQGTSWSYARAGKFRSRR